MDKKTERIFIRLFKEAVRQYFDHGLDKPLTENQSKLLCVDIERKTGLVLGYKSVKNYSIFLSEGVSSTNINPSLATLDTLARYVLKAPPTTEPLRKKNEDHFPYWHLYKKKKYPVRKFANQMLYLILLISSGCILAFVLHGDHSSGKIVDFRDDFSAIETNNLSAKSWKLMSPDSVYWQKRGMAKGYLNLFTLESDNWPDSSRSPEIKNLLIRNVTASCFFVEAHIEEFFPRERWQQAGIILMEDTSFSGRTMRISVAYNDFFGGFESPSEIIVQGITTSSTENPEEFLHHELFQLDSTSQAIVKNNLRFCRLRIEKNDTEYRILIAAGPLQNGAYKEIGRHTFYMTPKYVGIFALKGKVKESAIIPVKFDAFNLGGYDCDATL